MPYFTLSTFFLLQLVFFLFRLRVFFFTGATVNCQTIRTEASMEGTGGRNPPLPLPLNFVTPTRLPDDRRSAEEKFDNRPLLPPNYVSLRELRERRLKEERERERRREAEDVDRRHPSYITVRELEEQLFKEAREREREGNGAGRGGELQAQRLKEGKGKEEKKEKVGKEEGKETDQKGAKEKGDDAGKIEKKIDKLHYRATNLCSKEADRVCHVESGWVWEPKLPAAGTSADVLSVEPVISAEHAGVSHEVLRVSSDQNGAPQINSKNKCKDEKKKKEKKKGWKRDSGKDIHEPALNAERLMEATGVEVAEAPKASSKAPEEVTLSQNGNNTVRKVKGENMNINESSSQLVPGFVEVKRLNGTRSRRVKAQKGGNRMKNKEVNLSEPCQNVASMSEVKKGFDEGKEATGPEIENGKALKGKGKMVHNPESIDQIVSHEEAKEVHGVGDLIGSIGGSEVKGRSRNVTLSESSETGGQLGNCWRKRNLAAGSRGRGHPRAGRFPVRAVEHLSGGGGLVWVPKKGS